jgi:putative endonuclease
VPGPPAHDPRRSLATLGEGLAAAHLQVRGFQILARNVRTRFGEIDLIACDARTLVFAEVKTRRLCTGALPRPDQDPLIGLHPRQRARLRRLARAWLSSTRGSRPLAPMIRFDAIGVLLDGRGAVRRLEHLEAAW